MMYTIKSNSIAIPGLGNHSLMTEQQSVGDRSTLENRDKDSSRNQYEAIVDIKQNLNTNLAQPQNLKTRSLIVSNSRMKQ